MCDYLKSVARKEKIKITDEALELIARRGGGSFRDTLSLLDQISTLSKDEITKDMVVKAMGLPQDEMIDKLLSEYANGDLASITATLRELLLSGVKPETLTSEIIARIIDTPKPEFIPLLEKLSDVKDPYIEAKLLVAMSARVLPKPVSSSAGLDFSSTSYTGAPAEPPLQGKPVGPVRNIGVEKSNQNFMHSRETGLVTRANDIAKLNFNWDTFTNKVQELNDGVGSQLSKCAYEFAGGELKIYPKRKIIQTILAKPNNVQVLRQAADGVKITICEAGDSPSGAKQDETLSKISAIMGKEVSNYGGTSPF